MSEAKRILIVDDEDLARQRIARYLRQYGQPFAVEEAASGLQAVEKIRAFSPDVIFLDIEMPGFTGFEVLQQFAERPFHLIFQTAYDEFALRAFEEHACNYLLKPFTAGRLHQALARALSRVADQERLRALEARYAERDGYLRRLTVKHGGRLKIVEEKDIVCFVSRDHYTCVYFDGRREGIIDLSIACLSGRLDPRAFRQFHRNNIARLAAIAGLFTSRTGEMWIELNNGMCLPVSRSHRRAARELIKEMGQ